MTLGLPPGWWGPPWAAPVPRSIAELIRDGVLDADLGGLLWLLIEARLPIVVAAGPSGVGKSTLLAALLDFLPPDADLRPVLGSSTDLGWLPEAERLGWRPERRPQGEGSAAAATGSVPPADPERSVLLVPELSGHLPWYTWGETARTVVRAVSLGYGLATTIHAESLEEVLASLAAPPTSLSGDELSHLGVVLILRAVGPASRDDAPGRRVVAAHWIRPVARDVHGHLQRLGPAVLAAWDPGRDRLEHYAWGVIPELARRVGRRAGDFERAQATRAGALRELVASGVTEPGAVRTAIAGYRRANQDEPAA